MEGARLLGLTVIDAAGVILVPCGALISITLFDIVLGVVSAVGFKAVGDGAVVAEHIILLRAFIVELEGAVTAAGGCEVNICELLVAAEGHIDQTGAVVKERSVCKVAILRGDTHGVCFIVNFFN